MKVLKLIYEIFNMPPELLKIILQYRSKYMFQDRIKKLESQLCFPVPCIREGYQDLYYLIIYKDHLRICFSWYPFYMWFYFGYMDQPYELTVFKWKMEIYNKELKRKYEYETLF